MYKDSVRTSQEHSDTSFKKNSNSVLYNLFMES